MNRNKQTPSVQRILLQGGRSIEVLRFDETGVHPRRELHVCPECDCELVQPVAWSEAPESRWELLLQCPNCEWSDEDIYTHDQVEQFEERLDEGLSDMIRDLKHLTHANMVDQIDRFVGALNADLILPEDF
jgi:hypothetical protein